MSADPIRRSAARTATIVAVPVALVMLAASAFMYGGFGASTPPPPAATGPIATGPVTMDAPVLTGDAVGVCQQVVANLPETAAGHPRRPVTAGAEQNAAYGDPAITLTCGGAMPTFPATDDVYALSGVCWHPVASDTRSAWTTVDRAIAVTVTVPGPREGSAQSVIPFSPAIAAHNPPRDPAAVPPGCTG